MLSLRPSCEHCDKDLPNGSADAMICSYECTFCKGCVEGVLDNVCPNCGGGFVARPTRPAKEWRPGVSLAHQTATAERVHKPVDTAEHRVFAAEIKVIEPKDR